MPSLPCPICHKPVATDDQNMPFCSDRCRTQDLANWATERYSIPATGGTNEIEDERRDKGVREEGYGR